MQKSSNIFGTIKAIDNVVNYSPLGSAFMNTDLVGKLGRWVFAPKNKITGLREARTHFKLPGINPIKAPNFINFVGNAGLQTYKGFSPETKNKLNSFGKVWNKAADVQGGVFLAGMAANILDKPKFKQNVDTVGTYRPPGTKPVNTSYNGMLKSASDYYEKHRSEIKEKQKRYYQNNKFKIQKSQKKYRAKVQRGQIQPRQRITQGHSYTFGGRRSKAASNMRMALRSEIPFIFHKCASDFKKEFMLKSPESYRLLAHRLYSGDTYILGNLEKTAGFINGSFRPLPGINEDAYYIRVVHVSSKCAGMGLGAELVEEIIEREAPDSAVWMQICSDNMPMKKTASRLGFKHVDTWRFDNTLSEIWYRGY